MFVNGLYNFEFCKGLERGVLLYSTVFIYIYFIYSYLLFQQVRGRQCQCEAILVSRFELLPFQLQEQCHQLALFCVAS